jgi:hypothetical protein
MAMSLPKKWVAGLIIFAAAPETKIWAQATGGPLGAGAAAAPTAASALGAGPAAASPAAAAPAAAAAPKTIFGFFGLSSANIHACIAKLCNSQIGQLANNFLAGPAGAVSGGLIPPLCPPPSPAQIAALENKAPGGAEATAAKIKASEADAKARVAAVEYLGTVDCSRWKEATKALINALRADTNECVRYAAARVLNSGCCCNKATIEALKICVAGEDTDGNPPETSCRVKAAAFSALQNCLMRVPEILPEEEVKPKVKERERSPVPTLEPLPEQPLRRERSSMTDAKGTHLATSLSVPTASGVNSDGQPQPKTLAQTVDEARHTLVDVAHTSRPPTTLPPGKKSVFSALVKARQDLSARTRSAPAATPAPADPNVAPSSYVPGPGAGQGTASPGSSSTSSPAPETRRGLIGLLLNSRKSNSGE